MKKIFLLILLKTTVIMGQEVSWPSIELIMQSYNPNNTTITFTLTAVSPVWDYHLYGDLLFLTNDPSILTSSIEIEGTDFTNNNGWDMVTSKTDITAPDCGIGVYKLTNNETEVFIYLDFRECQFAFGSQAEIDTWFKYDAVNEIYSWNDLLRIDLWHQTDSEELIRIWDIKTTTPETDCVPNFWKNCLVLIPSINNHARLVWGSHPSFNVTNYKVYRAISDHPSNPLSLTYSLIATTGSNTYEYTDVDALLGGSGYYAYYYVKAYRTSSSPNYSPATNYVSTEADFEFNKIADSGQVGLKEFKLEQNFPNPFNPVTQIKYSLAQDADVTIKVYDMLGREVDDLVNELKQEGSYEINFSSEGLSSGVYIYRITATNNGRLLFTDSKQMILLR